MMIIKLLGTAAAEGWPALFCDCEACKKARALGGRNIRVRSSLLVDDALKIDFPPETLTLAHTYNLDLSKLQYLFFTHSHHDHLAHKELAYLFAPFALQDKSQSLSIYANAACLEEMKFIREAYSKAGRGDYILEVSPFRSYAVPPYKVTAVKAKHGTEVNPLNYMVEKDGKSLLYTCDTGYYDDQTWEFLQGRRVDLVISECTGGPLAVEYGTHMGFPDVLEFRDKTRKIGLTGDDTRWVLTHFSHGGAMLYPDLVELASPHGIEIGYDGMEIKL